ncbi:MAG: hypothetical protein H8D45_06970 [Bacteroidetes bacterium]|nr:hypothetical protein [Bacteroidota bacterium]MBL7104111.1 hypothetical protein [Bacteroidales bacterium]
MKLKSNLVLILAGVLLFSSCALQKGHLSFQGKNDEIIATPKIKDYLKTRTNPSIVLKAPNTETKSTQSDPNSYIYNAIEKELLIAGFDVKDRGLFNEVVSKSKEIDYRELKKLTNTELLLELVYVSIKIEYGTNKFYTKNGEQKVVNQNFTKYGAVIEFKLIIIETNEFAGSYSFYYTPCSSENTGCECEIAYKNYLTPRIYPYLSFCRGQNNSNKEYEYVSEIVMEDFVREGVKLMIKEMRN